MRLLVRQLRQGSVSVGDSCRGCGSGYEVSRSGGAGSSIDDGESESARA